MKYIKDHNVKNILEIGAAIGYSAILMASSTEDAMVTTIERDEERYMECLKNVKKCGLEKKINVVFQDALEVNLSEEVKYDLIFIDASKGNNINFFEAYIRNNVGINASENLLNFIENNNIRNNLSYPFHLLTGANFI